MTSISAARTLIRFDKAVFGYTHSTGPVLHSADGFELPMTSCRALDANGSINASAALTCFTPDIFGCLVDALVQVVNGVFQPSADDRVCILVPPIVGPVIPALPITTAPRGGPRRFLVCRGRIL